MPLTTVQLIALTLALQNTCANVTGTDGSVIWYDGSQLTACVTAAENALSAFVPSNNTNPVSIPVGTFISRFTAAEITLLWKAVVADTTGTISVPFLHGLTLDVINLNATGTVNWMNALVTAGVITSARETAILTP